MILDSIKNDNCFIQVIKNKDAGLFVLCDSTRFTIVPSRYYSSSLKLEYFSLTHCMKNDESIIENSCQYNDIHIIFSINSSISEELENRFSPSGFFHCTAALTSFIRSAPSKKNNSVLVFKSRKHFYLLICKKDALVLVNTYHFSGLSDIIYHSLNGLRVNQIPFSMASFMFCGSPDEHQALTHMTGSYTPNWHFISFKEIVKQINPVKSSVLNCSIESL